MKYLLLLILCVICACKCDPIVPFPDYNIDTSVSGSRGTANRDGEQWSGFSEFSWAFWDDSTKISIIIALMHPDSVAGEYLVIAPIPFAIGKHRILENNYDNSVLKKVGASYWIGHDDQTDAYYKSTDDKDNYIEVLSVDSSDFSLTCRFQVELRKDRSEYNFIDVVRFTDGYIEAKKAQ
jgi:hypothetical protein